MALVNRVHVEGKKEKRGGPGADWGPDGGERTRASGRNCDLLCINFRATFTIAVWPVLDARETCLIVLSCPSSRYAFSARFDAHGRSAQKNMQIS